MRIVFIVMRFGKDGLATNIRELAQGIVERGHELHIITSGFKIKETTDTSFFDDLKTHFDILGVTLHYFKEPIGSPLRKGLISVTSLLRITNLLIKLNADVIHCHSPNLTFIPWLMGKKFTSTVHADTIVPNARYKHPTLLIAVSEGSKEFTVRVMNSPENSIRMVYHGISERFCKEELHEDIETLKKKHNIPQDKLIVGVVGRITPQKGTDILVKAIGEHLPGSLKSQLHIVIVGDYQTKGQKKWLDNLLSEYDLTEKISVLGFRDPKPFYQLFDVFVLPSRSDTFGLVAVEAMMSRCCTIRSNSNGAYDQIDHGENGFIFPMDDATKLAEYLKEVLTDSSLRLHLAKKGQQKALDYFTTNKMVDNTLKVYQELLEL